MTETRLQARDLALASGLAALALILRIPLLRIPFERDEGEYAYIAWRLLFGEMPYRDWFDQKPPAVFWTYRAALSLPFEPVVAVHLVAALFVASSTFVLYCLVRRFSGRNEATLSAVVFLLLAADPRLNGSAANTELFMALPILLAHWTALLASPRERWLWFATGTLLGIATAYKQVAAVNFVLIAALVFCRSRSPSRLVDAIRFSLWSALGGLSVWLAVAIFFQAHGAWADLWRDVIAHNLDYVSALTPEIRSEAFRRTAEKLASSQAAVWGFALLGLATLVRRRGTRRNAGFYLLGWIITGAVGVGASGYFFAHYFQQLSAPVAILAGVGAASLMAEIRRRSDRFAWFRTAIPVVLTAQLLLTVYPFVVHHTPDRAVREIYPRSRFDVMPEVAERLREVTEDDDSVFIYGAEPEIYFYARRRSATRFIFLFPLFGPYPGALEAQQAAAREIRSAEPAAVVFFPTRLFRLGGAPQYLTHWTESWLQEEFELDSHIVAEDQSRGYLAKDAKRVAPGSILGSIYVRR